MWSPAHAAELRAVGIAVLALTVVWPLLPQWRLPLAGLGGVALVASSWSASFAGRSNQWALFAGVATAVALWWAVPRAHDALARAGGAWWLLLVSVAAVYACVPETDQMREVAVVVAAGGAAEAVLRRKLSTPALVAASAFVEWSALFGASGRGRALVGGLFALTPLVAVGAATHWSRSRRVAVWWPLAVGAVWSAAALVTARTGGIAATLPPAVLAAAGWTVAAALATAGLSRVAGR